MRPESPRLSEVLTFENLIAAAQRASRGHRKAADVAVFLTDIEREVLGLEREIQSGLYGPQPWRTFQIRDPKPRIISAAAFRDRVVQHALCHVIEPVLEHDACPASFACRVGGGVKRALAHAHDCVRHNRYALKLDIRHFFETLDHSVLRRLLWRRIKDPGLRDLINVFIDAGAPGSAAGRGLAIGNLTSQHFANFYLGPLDRHLQRGLQVPGQARYMDDLLIFGASSEQLWRVHNSVDQFVRMHLDLELKTTVTCVLQTSEGVSFLGFRIWPSVVRFDRSRRKRWLRQLNTLQRGLDSGSLSDDYVQRSAASQIGWSMHADTRALARAWVRRLA